MTNSEKVRLAVAHCLRSNDISICEECPYNVGNDYGCRARLRDDIITLLKAQEPHIISVDTVKALPNGAVVWQETNHPECERLEVGMVCKREGYAADIVFQTGEAFLDDLTETPEYFDGYKLRYWQGEPTEEQMEETPWN